MSSALTSATGVTCTRNVKNNTVGDDKNTQKGGYRYTKKASLASRDRLSQRMSKKKRQHKSKKRHYKSKKRYHKKKQNKNKR